MSVPRVSVIMPIKARREEDVGWAKEAIASVQEQTYVDWELRIVNDQSPVPLTDLRTVIASSPYIYAAKSKSAGVAGARNTGVESCQGELILPLDHDDILPPDALEVMVNAWDEGGNDFGVVYGDVLSFGPDFQRHMQMPQFSFPTLLKTLIMPIGSLHAKSSWKEVGGWKDEFQAGLEDWAYWIDLCVHGYWGYHVPQVVYHYRRHPHGRLASLRTSEDRFAKQRDLIKDRFLDYYNGKEPKMCKGCGGGRPARISGQAIRPAPAAVFNAAAATSGMIQVKYRGTRQGGFGVTGKATGWKYNVPGGQGCLVEGPSGRPGVHPDDVQFFRTYDGGRTFMVESA